MTVIIIRRCPSVDKIPEGKNPVFGQNKIRYRGNSRIQKGDGKPFAGGFCGKDALHQRHGKHLLSLSKYVKKHFSAQPCISLFEKEKRGKRCGRTETDGNVLHDELYQFAAEQMALYNVPPQRNITYYTFDANTCSWTRITRPGWLYNEKELLLVPKSIVRKRYLFCPRQFLSLIIIERMMKDNGQEDMRKVDIITNLPKSTKDWVYEKVIDFTQNNPDALVKYHELLPTRYADKRNIQDDEFLDDLIYGKKKPIIKSA